MEEETNYTTMIDQIHELMEKNGSIIKKYDTGTKDTTSVHSTYYPSRLTSGDWSYNDYNTYKDYIWKDTHITSTTSIDPAAVRHQELVARLEKLEKLVEDRLLVLRPDPEMLEKYELLQSIYEQYKAAEALLYGGDND